MGSHRAPGGQIMTPIRTYGEPLRFATVNPESITTWEVEFTSIYQTAVVESYQTPAKITDGNSHLPSRSLSTCLHPPTYNICLGRQGF